MGASQTRIGRCEEKNNFALPGIEPGAYNPQYVAVPTEVSRPMNMIFKYAITNMATVRNVMIVLDKFKFFTKAD
jgi:hypothetical protein